MSQQKNEIKSYDQLTKGEQSLYKLLAERDSTTFCYHSEYIKGTFYVFQN